MIKKNKQNQRVQWSQHTHNGNPRREGRKRSIKILWRNNVWKFPKFDERHKSTYSRSLMNSKQYKPKQSTPTHIITKLLKAKYKERILKTRGKWLSTMETKKQKNDNLKLLRCIPVQNIDLGRSWALLLAQTYLSYSHIWNIFILKKLKTGGVTLSNQANNRETTLKQVRKAEVQQPTNRRELRTQSFFLRSERFIPHSRNLKY